VVASETTQLMWVSVLLRLRFFLPVVAHSMHLSNNNLAGFG
jgi:hypothetical protein